MISGFFYNSDPLKKVNKEINAIKVVVAEGVVAELAVVMFGSSLQHLLGKVLFSSAQQKLP